MASIPSTEEIQTWIEQAEQEYTINAQPPDHPAFGMMAKRYYVEGYVRCKFRDWVIEAQTRAFAQTIPQVLGD